MPDIHLERDHDLGLDRARLLARQWADEAGRRFEMTCQVTETPEADTVEFTRSGCRGTLRVEAARFILDAKLGWVLGAFRQTIEAEIEKNLDRLLRPGD